MKGTLSSCCPTRMQSRRALHSLLSFLTMYFHHSVSLLLSLKYEGVSALEDERGAAQKIASLKMRPD